MGSLTRTTCKAILLVSQPPREEVGWLIGMGEPATDNWWVDGLSQALSKVIAVSLRLGSLLLGTQRASWYSRMANERKWVRSISLVGKTQPKYPLLVSPLNLAPKACHHSTGDSVSRMIWGGGELPLGFFRHKLMGFALPSLMQAVNSLTLN